MHGPDCPVSTFLAHSARPEQDIPAQDYCVHVLNVCERCSRFALAIKPVEVEQPRYKFMTARLMLAAEFHDLGKLNALNQDVLNGRRAARSLPIKHWDAGALYMTQKKAPLSALMIYAHHKGLPNLPAMPTAQDLQYRSEDENSCADSERNLEQYLTFHDTALQRERKNILKQRCEDEVKLPVTMRLLFSCLVDADHSDTAVNYNDLEEKEFPLLRARERLEALDRYIASLQSPGTKHSERNENRNQMYVHCRSADTDHEITFCDSPVGTGKTTALAACQLKTAADRNLRHLFIVLPFTNILNQTVDILREALRLPGESEAEMKRVVSAIHHKAEFEDENSRKLSVLWRAPIVVTTAVQFFETMAAASPSALRKLHELTNSSVFIDEAHTALPIKLWPLAWKWIKEYSSIWNCHFILASGSLYKLWKLKEIDEGQPDIPSLLPEDFRMGLYNAEKRRIRYRCMRGKMKEEELCDWLLSLEGPRLVILNTVQSAAVIAQMLKERCGADAVEHISTALAPVDREHLVDIIKDRLKDKKDTDWTLVATSCVEAGVNFSFRTGVREAAGLVNLLQLAGRIRRNDEQEYTDSTVWTIELNFDGLLKRHPSFDTSSQILMELFSKNENLCEENADLSKMCTDALRRELNELNQTASLENDLVKHEGALEFKTVEEKFKVIDTQTVTVIVDAQLKERLENHEPVDWRELQEYSVQIFCRSASKLGVEKLKSHPDIFFWPYRYDKFIGYMAGVLDNRRIDMAGGAFI